MARISKEVIYEQAFSGKEKNYEGGSNNPRHGRQFKPIEYINYTHISEERISKMDDEMKVEISETSVVMVLVKTLCDVRYKCAPDYDESKVKELLTPFLYYINSDNLSEEENVIGDIIRKYIFKLIYICMDEEDDGYDFILSVLTPMSGHLAKLSNGEWNRDLLRNPLRFEDSKGGKITSAAHIVELTHHNIPPEELI